MTSRRENSIRTRFRSIGLGVGAGVLVLAVLAGVAWYVDFRSSPTPYEGTKLDGAAPIEFRLVDQNGRSLTLADFRGKVVVLTLLDPYCTDICPIYAHHYRLAYQALGQDAAKVAFLAFNGNDERTSVEDMMAATRKWGVDEIPSWHFLTAEPEQLRAVWKAYGLLGSGPPKADKPAEKLHSVGIYVIDQSGRRRWVIGSTSYEGAPLPSALIVKHVRALLAEDTRQ